MKVFISWSGDISRQVAEALRDWLPMAIQAVKPYMNERDNEAGVRWEEVVSSELRETDFGILCLTPDNLQSTWLNFEAGALGKAVDRARVVPLLYKLAYTDVAPPLSMFMGKPLNEQGVKETLVTMNKHIDADRRLDQAALDGAFKAMWPILKDKLDDVQIDETSVDPKPREDRDILEEILEVVRSLSRPYTVLETAGGATRPRWLTPQTYNLGNTPGGALSLILGNILGPDVQYRLVGNRVIVNGAPSIPLRNELDRRTIYDGLVKELEELGLKIEFQPNPDPMTADSSPNLAQ